MEASYNLNWDFVLYLEEEKPNVSYQNFYFYML